MIDGRIARLLYGERNSVESNYHIQRQVPNAERILEIQAWEDGEDQLIATETTDINSDYLAMQLEELDPEDPETRELLENPNIRIRRLADHITGGRYEMGPSYQVRATRFNPDNLEDEDQLYNQARAEVEENGEIIAVTYKQ